MKRVQLVRELERIGCELVRHGGKHDWYRNLRTGVLQAVPRRREVNESLARPILRELSDARRKPESPRDFGQE